MASPVKLDPQVFSQIKRDHQIKTDSELAERIGISAPLLNQIRSGRRGVSALFITGMLTELDVPFEPQKPGGLYRLAEKMSN